MSSRIGIVGGSGFLDGPVLADCEERTVSTDRGSVSLLLGDGFAFVLRHESGGRYRPPHRVPHHAHALAFLALGIRETVGLCSVGSLDPAIGPGTAVVPDDYLSAHPPPCFDPDERLHIVPVLDEGMRSLLLAAARAAGAPVRDGGVYLETRGPRFETRAEIRFYRDHGDVIGMTAASEATLFQERGLAYAVLGMVDNFANGLGADSLTYDAYELQVERNRDLVRAILGEVILLHRKRGDE